MMSTSYPKTTITTMAHPPSPKITNPPTPQPAPTFLTSPPLPNNKPPCLKLPVRPRKKIKWKEEICIVDKVPPKLAKTIIHHRWCNLILEELARRADNSNWRETNKAKLVWAIWKVYQNRNKSHSASHVNKRRIFSNKLSQKPSDLLVWTISVILASCTYGST